VTTSDCLLLLIPSDSFRSLLTPSHSFPILFSGDETRLVLDRYFPCCSGDEYVEADDDEALGTPSGAAERATFALVSELHAIQEAAAVEGSTAAEGTTAAVEGGAAAAAGAASTASTAGAAAGAGDVSANAGANADAMRAQISRLERQLDSVTKCVACLVEDKDTCLMDCSHVCLCRACASRVTRCPICRCAVRDRRRVY